MIKKQPTIGLFGIGLAVYWAQFAGLEDRLKRNLAEIEGLIRDCGADVYNAGLVDTVEKAYEAGHDLRKADVDLIFLYATTYALSSTVLPVVRRAKVPVIVLNLQPESRIDYPTFNASGDRTWMTGDWLAYCGCCPVPEIANVFSRAGIAFHQVTGVLHDDAHVTGQITEWIEAARVAYAMQHNRLGLMGRYYNGMFDIYSDVTLQCATFGGHADIVEIDELAALRILVSDAEVKARLALFADEFDVQPDCDPAEMARAAKTSVALDHLVERHKLGSMAYYYESVPGHDHEDVISSVILGCSLLTAHGVPIAGEYEVKNVQAMKIMDCFGAGGSFSEFCAIDYEDDIVMLGHDGPGHIAIAEGKTKVRPLQVYHGKPGKGVSVEMSVKHGPVTLLAVVERPGGKLGLLVAEGESVPGPILEIGNTNSRYRFALGARGFIEAWNAQGPAHHCAIGTGHIANKLKKFSALVGIDITIVC